MHVNKLRNWRCSEIRRCCNPFVCLSVCHMPVEQLRFGASQAYDYYRALIGHHVWEVNVPLQPPVVAKTALTVKNLRYQYLRSWLCLRHALNQISLVLIIASVSHPFYLVSTFSALLGFALSASVLSWSLLWSFTSAWSCTFLISYDQTKTVRLCMCVCVLSWKLVIVHGHLDTHPGQYPRHFQVKNFPPSAKSFWTN